MRKPLTAIPGLVLNEREKARIAYLASDLDRRLHWDNIPDHAQLLGNLLEWIAQESIPLRVSGAGLVDCNLYRQANRLILHLVNLNNGTWRSPVHELIPIGPLEIEIKIPEGLAGSRVRRLVSVENLQSSRRGNWTGFRLDSLLDHEVVVIA